MHLLESPQTRNPSSYVVTSGVSASLLDATVEPSRHGEWDLEKKYEFVRRLATGWVAPAYLDSKGEEENISISGILPHNNK